MFYRSVMWIFPFVLLILDCTTSGKCREMHKRSEKIQCRNLSYTSRCHNGQVIITRSTSSSNCNLEEQIFEQCNKNTTTKVEYKDDGVNGYATFTCSSSTRNKCSHVTDKNITSRYGQLINNEFECRVQNRIQLTVPNKWNCSDIHGNGTELATTSIENSAEPINESDSKDVLTNNQLDTSTESYIELHYKWIIIGGLGTIVIILLIVFIVFYKKSRQQMTTIDDHLSTVIQENVGYNEFVSFSE
ncbi:hypothetical protein CHUAL_003631 [Chamberlinius hualienensis]